MSSKLSYGLLLDDTKGYRRLSAFVNKDQLEGEVTHKLVSKGSLLVQLNKTAIKAFKETFNCNINYTVYSVPSTETYLFVGNHKVLAITNEQRDFLYGIEGLTERLEVYKRLGWIEKLTEGSEVYVTIPTTPYPVKGVVRWIGKLTGEYGKKFGIELLENKGEESQETSDGMYRGHHYFSCESTKCAVFVSVDKLTDPQTANAAKLMQHVQSPSGENEIKLGNLVTFFDGNNDEQAGVVKWIGSDRSNVHDSTKIVGIEIERKIISTVPHNITNMKGYFAAKKSHSKIFLPITYVHKYTPPVKRGDDSSSPDVMPDLIEESESDDHFEDAPEPQAANLPSGRPSNFESDQQDVYYECHNDPDSPTFETIHKFQKGSEIIYNGHNGIIKWIGDLPGFKVPMAGLEMFQDHAVEDPDDGYWNDDQIYECTPLRGTFVELKNIQPVNGSKRRMPQGNPANPSKRPNIVGYNRLPQLTTGLNSGPTSLPSSSMVLNQNPYKLEKGSVVQYDHPPKYGVVKWIGIIPGRTTLYAGVEMDEVVDGSTDGIWVGEKYFESEPGKGKFVRLSELHPSQRSPMKHPAKDRSIIPLNKQSEVKKPDGKSTLKVAHPALETGCAVELGKPPDMQYGVIRWIRTIEAVDQAYVELEDGSGQTFPLHVLRRDSRFDDNTSKMEEKSNDGTKTETNDKPSKVGQTISQIFDVGSMIEFGDPVQYGVFKGLHNEYASVELENGECKIIPIVEIRPDSRFAFDVNERRGRNPLESKIYVHEGKSLVPPDEIFNEHKHTQTKGIQGYKNSCYLDATIYGMFTFSNAFDIAFLDEVTTESEISNVQNVLKNKIVYPLRVKGIVLEDSVQVFRSQLADLQNMKGLTSEEKDPEEFINLLFKHILKLEPFVTIRRPSGIDAEFLIQLFVEPNVNMTTVTTQELLTKMFKDNNITFAKYPAKLLLQVPRSGKKFKSFKRVIPSLQLDIVDLCKTSGPCFVCNKPMGCICNECGNEALLKHRMNLYFCATCWPLWHQKPHRRSHTHEIALQNNDDFDTGTLQLLSVLCIETSHYVCFTRITGSGKDEWVFFDSMAERQDNGYNIPEVIHCTNLLQTYVYGENKKDINRIVSRELPELVRRFVEDAYLCIYIDHDGVMYQ